MCGSYAEFAQKYGEMFQVKLGSFSTISILSMSVCSWYQEPLLLVLAIILCPMISLFRQYRHCTLERLPPVLLRDLDGIPRPVLWLFCGEPLHWAELIVCRVYTSSNSCSR